MNPALFFNDAFQLLVDRCVHMPGFLGQFNRLWGCTLTLEDVTSARMQAYADAAEAGILVQKGQEVCQLFGMIHDTIWLRLREEHDRARQ